MKKSFRKLKRIELMELVYQLRKDNIALQKRCEELEKKLEKTEEQLQACLDNTHGDAIARIEGMIAELYSHAGREG